MTTNFIPDADEEMLQCPYSTAHQITNAKIIMHLDRCRRNYLKSLTADEQKSIMKICRYNKIHHYPAPEIAFHEQRCPDAFTVVRHLAYHTSEEGVKNYERRKEEELKRRTKSGPFSAASSSSHTLKKDREIVRLSRDPGPNGFKSKRYGSGSSETDSDWEKDEDKERHSYSSSSLPNTSRSQPPNGESFLPAATSSNNNLGLTSSSKRYEVEEVNWDWSDDDGKGGNKCDLTERGSHRRNKSPVPIGREESWEDDKIPSTSGAAVFTPAPETSSNKSRKNWESTHNNRLESRTDKKCHPAKNMSDSASSYSTPERYRVKNSTNKDSSIQRSSHHSRSRNRSISKSNSSRSSDRKRRRKRKRSRDRSSSVYSTPERYRISKKRRSKHRDDKCSSGTDSSHSEKYSSRKKGRKGKRRRDDDHHSTRESSHRRNRSRSNARSSRRSSSKSSYRRQSRNRSRSSKDEAAPHSRNRKRSGSRNRIITNEEDVIQNPPHHSYNHQQPRHPHEEESWETDQVEPPYQQHPQGYHPPQSEYQPPQPEYQPQQQTSWNSDNRENNSNYHNNYNYNNYNNRNNYKGEGQNWGRNSYGDRRTGGTRPNHDRNQRNYNRTYDNQSWESSAPPAENNTADSTEPKVLNEWGLEEEDWEADCAGNVAGYDPQEKLKNEIVIHNPQGLTKSERKLYRNEVKERALGGEGFVKTEPGDSQPSPISSSDEMDFEDVGHQNNAKAGENSALAQVKIEVKQEPEEREPGEIFSDDEDYVKSEVDSNESGDKQDDPIPSTSDNSKEENNRKFESVINAASAALSQSYAFKKSHPKVTGARIGHKRGIGLWVNLEANSDDEDLANDSDDYEGLDPYSDEAK